MRWVSRPGEKCNCLVLYIHLDPIIFVAVNASLCILQQYVNTLKVLPGNSVLNKFVNLGIRIKVY